MGGLAADTVTLGRTANRTLDNHPLKSVAFPGPLFKEHIHAGLAAMECSIIRR
jgi:hypothetical protein